MVRRGVFDCGSAARAAVVVEDDGTRSRGNKVGMKQR